MPRSRERFSVGSSKCRRLVDMARFPFFGNRGLRNRACNPKLQALDEKLQPVDQADFDDNAAALHTQIEEQAFAAAWAAGRAMSLEAVIQFALEEPTDG